MNSGGIGRLIISKLSRLFSSCSSIRKKMYTWWLENVEIRYLLWDVERYRDKQLNKYCKKKYHRLFRAKTTLTKDKREYTVEYLECGTCGWKFFATIEDKNKHRLITSGKRYVTKEFAKLIKEVER